MWLRWKLHITAYTITREARPGFTGTVTVTCGSSCMSFQGKLHDFVKLFLENALPHKGSSELLQPNPFRGLRLFLALPQAGDDMAETKPFD